MTDHQDNTMNASPADEPETTVVESNTVQAAELAWSRDDGVDNTVPDFHRVPSYEALLTCFARCRHLWGGGKPAA